MPKAKIIFFSEDGNSCSLLNWLKKQSGDVSAECVAAIGYLQEMGYDIRRPHADYLRDGIHELRIKVKGIHYRLLYFFSGKSIIVISHGFIKKQNTVPLKEIEFAIQRKKLFESNPDKHTFKESYL